MLSLRLSVADAAENRHVGLGAGDHDGDMLELALKSGQVVAFDGRIVEVFPDEGTSTRLHVAHLRVAENGESAIRLEPGGVVLRFDGSERPALDRLLAAIAASQRG